jgi:transcriptional regulator with XRE-family HTH domain
MNRIKELRKRNNIKQIELCKQLGISQATLSGWENEKFEADLKSIKKMSNIFSVSIDYLLGTTDYPLDGKEKAAPELEQQKTNTITYAE